MLDGIEPIKHNERRIAVAAYLHPLVESKFSSGGYCTTGTSVRSRRTLAATGDPNAHDPMALNSAVAPAWPFEPKADRKGRFRLLA